MKLRKWEISLTISRLTSKEEQKRWWQFSWHSKYEGRALDSKEKDCEEETKKGNNIDGVEDSESEANGTWTEMF